MPPSESRKIARGFELSKTLFSNLFRYVCRRWWWLLLRSYQPLSASFDDIEKSRLHSVILSRSIIRRDFHDTQPIADSSTSLSSIFFKRLTSRICKSFNCSVVNWLSVVNVANGVGECSWRFFSDAANLAKSVLNAWISEGNKLPLFLRSIDTDNLLAKTFHLSLVKLDSSKLFPNRLNLCCCVCFWCL